MKATKKELALLVIQNAPGIGPGWMIGPAYAERRREIVSMIKGKRVPRAKAGITAMMEALYRIFPIVGYTCLSDKENRLQAEIDKAATI